MNSDIVSRLTGKPKSKANVSSNTIPHLQAWNSAACCCSRPLDVLLTLRQTSVVQESYFNSSNTAAVSIPRTTCHEYRANGGMCACVSPNDNRLNFVGAVSSPLCVQRRMLMSSLAKWQWARGQGEPWKLRETLYGFVADRVKYALITYYAGKIRERGNRFWY